MAYDRFPILRDRAAVETLFAAEGASLRTIARAVGCSPEHVRQAAKALGIVHTRRAPWRPGSHFPHLRQRNWLLSRYVEAGLSLTQIAAELGCSSTTVANALDRHGIPRRRRDGPRASTFAALNDEAWLRARYVDDGWSYSRIADVVGCSPATVQRAARRLGIPSRPAGYYDRAAPWRDGTRGRHA